MGFELDHIFICVSEGAPEAERLIQIGFTEGPNNQHPGQGTANRRFFFNNAMIELLFLTNEREARSDLVAPTRLYERCRYRESGASPFGICLRPVDERETGVPFEYWDYRPPYLPQDLSIRISATSSLIDEPLLFFIPFRVRPRGHATEMNQFIEHAAGMKNVTGVRVTSPTSRPPSAALSALVDTGFLSLEAGSHHLMEIEFDGGTKGQAAQLEPVLPLGFRW